MTTSVVTDGQTGGGAKPSNRGGGGRRKTKGSQLTKKNKEPGRGMSVAQLERIRLQNEASLSQFNRLTASGCNSVPNVAVVHYRPPSPAMLFPGIHGANLYPSDHGLDPPVVGSSNLGFRFENCKQLSSISSYMRCGSDCCGGCHKKKRINGGCNPCSVNPFRSGNNAVVEMMDAGKTRRSSGQVTEVMAGHRNGRNGGSSLTAYEFFPGKGDGGAEEYKELLRMGSMTTTKKTTTTWCGSGSGSGCSVAGAVGFRGGEGSCVTAETGSEEGNVSSLDLSLKLSY